MPQSNEANCLTRIAEIKGLKGRATFATAIIPTGTLIFSEEPILNIDLTTETAHSDLLASYADLPKDRQELVLDLTTNDPNSFRDVVWKELGIRTYGGWWDLNQKYGPHAKQILTAFNTNAVGPHLGIQTAMLNHSCLPNAYAAFDEAKREITVHALRDIEKGEEICISHLEGAALFAPMNERRGMLVSQRGFVCLCDACMEVEGSEGQDKECPAEDMRTDLRALVDKYRRNEAKLRKHFGKRGSVGLDPTYLSLLVEVSAGVIELMERLGLATIDMLEWYQKAIRHSLAIKDEGMATKWQGKMLNVVGTCLGEGSRMYIEMQQDISGAVSSAWEEMRASFSMSLPSNDHIKSEKAVESDEEPDGIIEESSEEDDNPNDDNYEDEDEEMAMLDSV